MGATCPSRGTVCSASRRFRAHPVRSSLCFESEQNGLFTVSAVTSADDGATWGNHRCAYTPTGMDNNAGAPQVANADGTLIVSFMTNEDTGAHTWTTGANAKLILSADGGATWGNKTMVSSVQSNWTCLFNLGSSGLVYMVNFGSSKAQRVVLPYIVILSHCPERL
jgi:hypothetical protein